MTKRAVGRPEEEAYASSCFLENRGSINGMKCCFFKLFQRLERAFGLTSVRGKNGSTTAWQKSTKLDRTEWGSS